MSSSTDHSSDVDVVDTLTTDHREASELIEQARGAADPEQRRDLADQLVAELVRHSVAEEMFVYPAMRDSLPDGPRIVDEDTSEHKALEAAMKRLESADAAQPAFREALDEVERLFRDHIRDEEGEQFVQLRAHLSQEQLVSLKGKVEAAKAVAPTRPHPAAPNAELFHKTVGAGVGMVDRLRDALSGRST